MTTEVPFPAARLGEWLSARIAGAPAVEIRDVREPAQGFSSRTVMFTAAWTEGGVPHERPLVARLQRDVAVPMLADVFHQYRVMRAIAAHSSVRVPTIDFMEDDPAVLGTPFFLMDRVEGRVPPDFPSYHEKGWIAEELDAAERGRLWWNGIREMHRLHAIDWRAFPFLANGATAAPGAVFYLENFVARWYDWASDGRSFPQIEEALAFLIANPAPSRQSGCVWNDARLGNTMFRRDGEIASLFDFEVASLGPPEVDLAHWLYLDDVFSLNFGIAPIDGLPDEAEAITGFERIYGWPMPYFSYYQAVAALKILILSVRDYSNNKTMETPDALPDFLVGRVELYLARYRAYLEG